MRDDNEILVPTSAAAEISPGCMSHPKGPCRYTVYILRASEGLPYHDFGAM